MSIWQNLFYNKSTRRLRLMLEAVRMGDFSLRFSVKELSGEERRMAEEINAVIQEFREMERNRVGQSHFYEAILSEVDTLQMAVDYKGHVCWMNKAAIMGLCGFRIDNLDNLSALSPSLPKKLRELKRGRNQLLTFTTTKGEERQYATTMSEMVVKGISYRLYSMQSVATILKQGEIMAEQRLIRVLTHEIMNSLTPIVSLSETLTDNLTDNKESALTSDDATMALKAISRRANGLIQFVERYRELSGIPKPVLEMVKVGELIHALKALPALAQGNGRRVEFEVECGDRFVAMDRGQIEQVLINLLKNASETSATRIVLSASVSEDDRWLIISVEDNGGGFHADAKEDMFTPFFTTKQGGQGIGLALCRQIVSNHGGLIGAEVLSGEKEEGARFTVRLPMRG